MQLLSFVFLVILTTIAAANTWKRTGLGRPIWATSISGHPTHFLLVSSTATVARLDASTGEIQWRLPAPISATGLATSGCAVNGTSLLVALSNDFVRAVRVEDGAVLWSIPGCGLGTISDHFVAVKDCATGKMLWVNSSGTLAPEQKTAHLQTPSPLPEISPESESLAWTVGDVKVVSQPDGLVVAATADRELWRLEEGMSHPLAAGLYVHQVSSVLVILSELSVIFGLDAADGKQLWKLPMEGSCSMVDGHSDVVIVVCTHANARATAIDAHSGRVLWEESVKDFAAIRASVQLNLDSPLSVPSVRLSDSTGVEKILPASNYYSEIHEGRVWLAYEKGGTTIRGVRSGEQLWQIDMPSSSKISSVAIAKPPHPSTSRLRPPAVRVTGDRRLLYKYIDPDLALVLAHDEELGESHALLFDARTGTVHDAAIHPGTAPPLSTVRGESWFAYTLWSTVMLQQEVHIIDMYHQPRNLSWVPQMLRSAVGNVVGPVLMNLFDSLTSTPTEHCRISDDMNFTADQCSARPTADLSAPNGRPYVVRANSLLTKRVQSLETTETQMGLTEPSVIMTLESGQVTLVSKFLLDARRPKDMNEAYAAEYLLQYKPVISLQSTSRESQYVDEGNHIPGVKTVAVAPYSGRESTCQLAVVGTDLVFSLIQPVGNFDSLPEDFRYSGVLGMIVLLTTLFIYTRGLRVKASLTRAW